MRVRIGSTQFWAQDRGLLCLGGVGAEVGGLSLQSVQRARAPAAADAAPPGTSPRSASHAACSEERKLLQVGLAWGLGDVALTTRAHLRGAGSSGTTRVPIVSANVLRAAPRGQLNRRRGLRWGRAEMVAP